VPARTMIFKHSARRHFNFSKQCRSALKFLILVPAGTKILQHSAGRHCVPGSLSALFFFFFFQQKGTRHGWHACEATGGVQKNQPLPPLINPLTPHSSINTTMLFKANGGLESVERNRESFQECFE
jgi:hypothetical protein